MSAVDPELLALTELLQEFDVTSVADSPCINTATSPPKVASISSTKACRAQRKLVAVAARTPTRSLLQSAGSRAVQGKLKPAKKPRRRKPVPIEQQRVYDRRSAKKKLITKEELRVTALALELAHCVQLEHVERTDSPEWRCIKDKAGICRDALERAEGMRAQAETMRWCPTQLRLVKLVIIGKLTRLRDRVAGSSAQQCETAPCAAMKQEQEQVFSC